MTQPWYVTTYGENYYQTFRDQFTAEETHAEVDGILTLLSLEPGARVLDLCCGFGRHSLELARRGFQVTGLDLSPALLHHAREEAQAEGLEITWIEADMREIPDPPQPYDAVVCLFSSFGIFDETQEEIKVAQAISRVLVPGGRLLMDTVNREIMLRRWAATQWQELGDGTYILYRRRFEIEKGLLHTREVMIHPDGRQDVDEHCTRLWAYTEFVTLLRSVGLGECRPYGDFQGTRYTWDSHRMVVTARRSN